MKAFYTVILVLLAGNAYGQSNLPLPALKEVILPSGMNELVLGLLHLVKNMSACSHMELLVVKSSLCKRQLHTQNNTYLVLG